MVSAGHEVLVVCTPHAHALYCTTASTFAGWVLATALVLVFATFVCSLYCAVHVVERRNDERDERDRDGGPPRVAV
jgi:hypothetical protein